jgi:hypothetical protein
MATLCDSALSRGRPFAIRAGLRKIALGEVSQNDAFHGLRQPGPRRSAEEKCCHSDLRRGRLRATLGATPGGYTGNPGRTRKPYFAGVSRSHFKVAEREGFEPPIGLHLCRISSAVHSTTLPPLQAPNGMVPSVGAGSRRGRPDRQGAGARNSASRGQTSARQEWDRQTRKKPAVPCRVIEIVAGKCGFAGQPERRFDGSDPLAIGNAICVLT